MGNLIGCRHCDELDCRGCNNYILEQALKQGYFNGLMHEHAIHLGGSVKLVVPGKWLPDFEDDVFNCSVCDGIMVRNVYNFCPWCGADMRGG